MEPTSTIIGYVPSSKSLATEFKDERGVIIKDEETILKSEKVARRHIHEFLSHDENLHQYNVPDKVTI